MNLENKKDYIIQLYKEDKKSIRAIASIVGCSFSGVKRLLHKYKVPIRNKCASLNLCPDSFTKKEFDIILGTTLGDGHLVYPKKNGESQLYIGHSWKQKKYIEYKHESLKRWIGCKIYPLTHKLNDKKYTTLNFITRKSIKFTEVRNIFYRERRKIFPYEFIAKNINEQSLAIFAMDDGYNDYNRGFEFCSESFSEKENYQLSELLFNIFNIKSHIVRVRKKSYRVKINKKDKCVLFDAIRKFIIPSMSYKIKSPETIRRTLK